MKLGLSNKLLTSPINSVPLSERASLGVSFDRSRYTNPAGFARQQSVGSSNILLQSYAGPSPVFSRATSGTFRNAAGLIERAPENLVQWSEDFSNASFWVRTGIAAFGSGSISNATSSPDGQLTADLVVEDTTTGVHRIESMSALSMVDRNVATFSVFVKMYGSTNEVGISFRDGGLVIFNLISKTYFTYNQPPAGTVLSSAISEIGGGWFRLSSTIQSLSAYNRRAGVQLCSNGQPSYAGNSSRGVYVWGMQLERHTSARPYISTTSAAVYGPRFEYATNGEPLGLLMEEQSTNLLSYSEQFDNAYWDKTTTPVTITANSISAPDGLTTADRMLETTGNLPHIVFSTTPNPNITSGLVYCSSIFCKKGTGATAPNWIQLAPRGTGFANGEYANFNIFSGTVGSYSGSIAPKIEYVGNGWYRCTMFATATSTTSSNTGFAIGFNNNSGSATRYPAYVGSTTADVYIWGAQLEAKPFATSYIPTVAGSATRNADVLSLPVGTWYDPNAGTIQFEGDRIASPDSNAQGFDSFFTFYSDLAAYNVLTHIGASGYEQFEAALDGFGTSAYTYIGTEIAPNTPIKLAITYDSPPLSASSYYASVNGSEAVSTSGADPLETPDVLKLGSVSGNSVLFGPLATSYFNGHIKSFTYTTKYWPDKIQALTA